MKRLYIRFKSLVNDFVYSFGRAALLLLVELLNHTVPVRERRRIRDKVQILHNKFHPNQPTSMESASRNGVDTLSKVRPSLSAVPQDMSLCNNILHRTWNTKQGPTNVLITDIRWQTDRWTHTILLQLWLTIVIRWVLICWTWVVHHGKVWQHVTSVSTKHQSTRWQQNHAWQHCEDLVCWWMQS